jgi:hypothetical protein
VSPIGYLVVVELRVALSLAETPVTEWGVSPLRLVRTAQRTSPASKLVEMGVNRPATHTISNQEPGRVNLKIRQLLLAG